MYFRSFQVISFLLMGGLYLNSQNELKYLRIENARLNQEARQTNHFLESETAFYQYRLNDANNTIKIYEASYTKESQKKLKTEQVRKLIKNDIRNLPTDSCFDDAKSLTGHEISNIAKAIVDYSDRYDVPLYLSLALIKHESAFNLKAISKTGAQGLAQLMPSTAENIRQILGYDQYDPWNPKQNVQFGIFYLSTLLDRYGQEESLAINAYNRGPEAVDRNSAKPLETKQHEERIMRYAAEFKDMGL